MNCTDLGVGLIAAFLCSVTPRYAATAGCILPSGARPDLSCTMPHNSFPKVLYIGDSVSIDTMAQLAQELQNTADICHVYNNADASSRGVKCTYQWLNETAPGVKWNYVLFNFGLHDLLLSDSGTPVTSRSTYKQNLRIVVNTIRHYGAVPIWVTTTPIPDSLVGAKFGNPAPYAAIATSLMATLQVPIIDTYSIILPKNETAHPPNDVHWSWAATEILSHTIAGALAGEIDFDHGQTSD